MDCCSLCIGFLTPCDGKSGEGFYSNFKHDNARIRFRFVFGFGFVFSFCFPFGFGVRLSSALHRCSRFHHALLGNRLRLDLLLRHRLTVDGAQHLHLILMNMEQLDGCCLLQAGSAHLDGHGLARLNDISFAVLERNINRLHLVQQDQAVFQCCAHFVFVHRNHIQLYTLGKRSGRYTDLHADVAGSFFHDKGRRRGICGHQLHVGRDDCSSIHRILAVQPAQEDALFFFRGIGKRAQRRANLYIPAVCGNVLSLFLSGNQEGHFGVLEAFIRIG